jgi:AcrR family transcriptional regulator
LKRQAVPRASRFVDKTGMGDAISGTEERNSPMSRKVGSVGAQTAKHIHEAGIRLIHERGFEAMSLRELAAAVGLQPGSLYNHIPNKQALLFAIMRDYMADLIASADEALDAEADPITRLGRFVDFHMRYHMARKADLRIVNLELRSLDPEHRVEVVALRDDYELRLDRILRDGDAAGVFHFADARVATFAILAMLTGVASWWRPDGRMSVETLIETHQQMVFGAVQASRTVG